MSAVKTTREMKSWSFSTRTYHGRCPLAKDKTTVTAVFTTSGAMGAPDVCEIENWFRDTVENDEWTAEELAVAASDKWGMECRILMTAASHGPIEVVA